MINPGYRCGWTGRSATKVFVSPDFIAARRKAGTVEWAAALGQGGLRGCPGPKDEFVPRRPPVEEEISRQGGQTVSTDSDTGTTATTSASSSTQPQDTTAASASSSTQPQHTALAAISASAYEKQKKMHGRNYAVQLRRYLDDGPRLRQPSSTG